MLTRNLLRPRSFAVHSIFLPSGTKTSITPKLFLSFSKSFSSTTKVFAEQKEQPIVPEEPVVPRQERPVVDDAQDTIYSPNAIQRSVVEIENGTAIYLGPLAGPVKMVKRISISSLFITSFGAPVLLTFNDSSVPFIARLIACSAVMLFSACTTLLVNITCSSYVTEMRLLKDKKTEEIHKSELEKLKSGDKLIEKTELPFSEDALKNSEVMGGTENAVTQPGYYNFETGGCSLEIKTLNIFGNERSVITPIDEIQPANNFMGTVNFIASGKKIFIHSFLLEESGNRWLVDKLKVPTGDSEPVVKDEDDE